MHDIEPYTAWKILYDSSEDHRSPFFGRPYHEALCSSTIYNYYIHPQWDGFGSSTLYLKILYADYDLNFCVIELLGEWNDCLYNDIMFLKRNVVDDMIDRGIRKFILIGENVLNFHASENDYYQEWVEDAENGWIALLNIRDYVMGEFRGIFADNYVSMGGILNHIKWRTLQPLQLFDIVNRLITKKLIASNSQEP
ncbi:MAG: hypothetical protein U1C46_10540 [Bacteroidales bacterium]|nr:hypothetical protein [Bacteroidales bacterium]MDZ4205237.1 hypothetical protein [Bacteroidales bacterium]